MDSLTPLSQVLGTLQLAPAGGPAGGALERLAAQALLEATLLEATPQGVRLRLADGQEILAQGSLPFQPGSLLALRALPLPGGAGLRLQVMGATPPPPDPVLAPLVQGEAAPLLARLQAPPEALASLADLFRALAHPEAATSPEAWSGWIKAAATALADPTVSPREAGFHQLQAQEGTALFEMPLPWAPQDPPLRMWVESDAPGQAGQAPSKRVFLSVSFSDLGEVRLGVERSPAGVRARIWVKDPQRLDRLRGSMESELSGLGAPALVQILPLPDPAPDLRALAGAVPLAALG